MDLVKFRLFVRLRRKYLEFPLLVAGMVAHIVAPPELVSMADAVLYQLASDWF